MLSEHDAAPTGPSGYEDLQEYADYDRYFNDFDEDEQASSLLRVNFATV